MELGIRGEGAGAKTKVVLQSNSLSSSPGVPLTSWVAWVCRLTLLDFSVPVVQGQNNPLRLLGRLNEMVHVKCLV